LRIADHLRTLPMGWFGRQRSGDLGARLTSDLELVEHLWSHFLGVFVSGLSMPLFLVVFLLWMDWHLALVVLAGIPLAVLALAWSQHAAARPSTRVMAASSAAQSALLEYVQGIAVIRSFGRFGMVWQRLQADLNEHHRALLAVEIKPAPWLAAYGFLLETGYLCLVLAGAWWLADGTLTPSTLLLFLVLALPVYRQLFEVGLSTLMLRFARRALARIEQILDEAAMPEPATPKAPHGHEIVFERVQFAYAHDDAEAEAQPPALFDLSCRIPAQRLTAVVGPSGAGKSTLVHLIARLWDVDAGGIRLGGVDVRELPPDVLMQHVALVFQDSFLFSTSIADNIRLGCPAATLEQVQPTGDWEGFLRDRLERRSALTGGIEAAGWRLVYQDTPSAYAKASSRESSGNFIYSLGLALNSDGVVGEVRWDSPAFNAGVGTGTQIVAVNDTRYSREELEQAIRAAKDSPQPIRLLLRETDRYRHVDLDWHGGLRYPTLERIEGTTDYLTPIFSARP